MNNWQDSWREGEKHMCYSEDLFKIHLLQYFCLEYSKSGCVRSEKAGVLVDGTSHTIIVMVIIIYSWKWLCTSYMTVHVLFQFPYVCKATSIKYQSYSPSPSLPPSLPPSLRIPSFCPSLFQPHYLKLMVWITIIPINSTVLKIWSAAQK